MNILFIVAEAYPFVKTGGLGDVGGALPRALAERGHDVRVVLPLYGDIGQEWREKMTYLACWRTELAWRRQYCGVLALTDGGVTYYFLDNEYYFKRPGLYGHYDDGERFAFFAKAAAELPERLGWTPDVLHANDWHCALVPVYRRDGAAKGYLTQRPGTVFTIHNIAYQGRFGREMLEEVLGLGGEWFTPDGLEAWGQVNYMKGGIMTADRVTTVSPTYAGELRRGEWAHGLEGAVACRGQAVSGILNGIDTALYDPSSGGGIAAPYTAENPEGKAACKAAAQRALGLKEEENVPLVVCVSRLVEHKGFSLVTEAFAALMERRVQFAVLGTGEGRYERFFLEMQRQYPTRAAARIQYSEALARTLYAGADIFLMPSLSEPCGLAQMMAMRYGAVPVVRRTGGLADTVPDWGEPGGLGFAFVEAEAGALLHCLDRALGLYAGDRGAWRRLMARDMAADFGWAGPAAAYEKVYRAAKEESDGNG